MSDKRKRSKLIYWVCLLAYTVALAAICVLALKAVWSFAEQYQASMPEPVVEKYIAGLNSDLFDAGVADTIAAMPHEVQTDEECQQAVRDILNGEITYARTATTEADTNAYAICCNDSTFGTVYLKRDETKGKEYIIESGIHYDVLESYYSINPNLPTKVTYRFDDVIGYLEPVIYDENGNEFTVDPEQDDSQYIKPCDDATVERLNSFCTKFVEEYTKYTSGIYGTASSGGYQNVAQYLVSGGDLDKRLLETLDGYSWAHTNSYSLDSYTFNNAINIGEGYYVCDVTTETTSVTSGNGEQHDTNNLKILVIDNAGTLKVYSLI